MANTAQEIGRRIEMLTALDVQALMHDCLDSFRGMQECTGEGKRKDSIPEGIAGKQSVTRTGKSPCAPSAIIQAN